MSSENALRRVRALADADQELANSSRILDAHLEAITATPGADRIALFMGLAQSFATHPDTEALAVFTATALIRLTTASTTATDSERIGVARRAAALLASTGHILDTLSTAITNADNDGRVDRAKVYEHLLSHFVAGTGIDRRAPLPGLAAAAVLRLATAPTPPPSDRVA